MAVNLKEIYQLLYSIQCIRNLSITPFSGINHRRHTIQGNIKVLRQTLGDGTAYCNDFYIVCIGVQSLGHFFSVKNSVCHISIQTRIFVHKFINNKDSKLKILKHLPCFMQNDQQNFKMFKICLKRLEKHISIYFLILN